MRRGVRDGRNTGCPILNLSLDTATRQRLAALAIAGTVAAGGLVFYNVTLSDSGAPAQAVDPVASVPATGAATITVHVSGAVARPGLVEIPHTARVADAVAAAGGATAAADLAGINLADGLHDAQQIVVPGFAAGEDRTVADGLIHLNRATEEELEAIPGVGPVLAGRIVAARDELGGFTAVEDLLDVSGIGEARLATFRDLVAVP